MIEKICSRKLWTAAGFLAGLAMVFGLEEDMISNVSGAVMSVASVITYICNETRLDIASVEARDAAAEESGEAA